MQSKFPINGSRDALWMATAPVAPSTTPFAGSANTDVAIVGGGLTALNAALELARYVVMGHQHSTGVPLSSPKTLAMHRFHRAGVNMAVKWFALQDHLDRYR